MKNSVAKVSAVKKQTLEGKVEFHWYSEWLTGRKP